MIGPLVSADDICLAVEQTLSVWLPSIIREEAAATSKPALAPPATFEQLPDEAASTTAQFPSVIVSSPGLADTPQRKGDGSYTVPWDIVVSFILRGTTYRETASRTRRYAAIVRTALAQHGIPDAELVEWVDESYARLPSNIARTLAMGNVAFTVHMPDVLNDTEGPDEPPDDTSPDYPVQTSTDIDIVEEPA